MLEPVRNSNSLLHVPPPSADTYASPASSAKRTHSSPASASSARSMPENASVSCRVIPASCARAVSSCRLALVETIIGSSSAKHRMIGTSATQITVRKMRV